MPWKWQISAFTKLILYSFDKLVKSLLRATLSIVEKKFKRSLSSKNANYLMVLARVLAF